MKFFVRHHYWNRPLMWTLRKMISMHMNDRRRANIRNVLLSSSLSSSSSSSSYSMTTWSNGHFSALLAIWPVNSLRKSQWRRAWMFSLICAWINGWVNNSEAGDLRRHRAHYDVIVMFFFVVAIVVVIVVAIIIQNIDSWKNFHCNPVWHIFLVSALILPSLLHHVLFFPATTILSY